MDLTDIAGTGAASFDLAGGGRITAEIHNAMYVPRPEEPEPPPFTSRIAEMPINPTPTHPSFIERGWTDWPRRHVSSLTGITIHHTMSHSPVALARYCTGPKGLPSIQYHFWVSAGDGCPVWQLVPLPLAIWHDHTGANPTTVSVGLAGRLHEHTPPLEQLQAAVRLCRWLMREHGLVIEDTLGHMDRAPAGTTVCSGARGGGPCASWDDEPR